MVMDYQMTVTRISVFYCTLVIESWKLASILDTANELALLGTGGSRRKYLAKDGFFPSAPPLTQCRDIGRPSGLTVMGAEGVCGRVWNTCPLPSLGYRMETDYYLWT